MKKLITLLLFSSCLLRGYAWSPDTVGVPLVDTVAPTIICPPNATFSTDPFNCLKFYTYTVAVSDDQPGVTYNQTQGQPSNTYFALGTTVNAFLATDASGNTASCSFSVTIADFVYPAVDCDDYTVVNLGYDDPNDCSLNTDSCHFSGHAWINAGTFDNGTSDNCNPNLKFTIQRLPPYTDCVNNLNQTNGHPPCDDNVPDFPSEFERAVSEGDSIKFYACEVGSTFQLLFRVYPLEPNGSVSLDINGEPMVGECVVTVLVQDKLKPLMQCPPNVTVDIIEFDTTLASYGKPAVSDNICLNGAFDAFGQCGLEHTVNGSAFDSVLHTGTIVRHFKAHDCSGNTRTCSQQVVVEDGVAYFVRFPDDVVTNSCNLTDAYGEPEFYNPYNRPLGVSWEDQIESIVPDACFKIERTWTLIDWYTYNPNLPCMVVPNPAPNAVPNHPANLVGPVVSLAGAHAPWTATVTKVASDDPIPTDFSIFWDYHVNCFNYVQHIKVLDTDSPQLKGGPYDYNALDTSANDPLLWNEPYWNIGGGPDRPETAADIHLSVSDSCSGYLLNCQYLLFLDLNNDGVQETVVNSSNLPPAATVFYDNAQSPGYIGGEARVFDERPVVAGNKYRFALQHTSSGNISTYSVAWHAANTPTNYVAPELPYGSHRIKWIISDNCGNDALFEYPFALTGPATAVETPTSEAFFVGRNYPNPYSDETLIPIRLSEAMPVTLTVFDVAGRVVYTEKLQYPAGTHTVRIHGEQLGHAAGVLYYQFETPLVSVVRQMLRLH